MFDQDMICSMYRTLLKRGWTLKDLIKDIGFSIDESNLYSHEDVYWETMFYRALVRYEQALNSPLER